MADPRRRIVANSSLVIDDVIMTSLLSLLKTIYMLPNFLILSDTLLFYTMMWIIRALWLVVAHDLSEDRYMDDVTENSFWLFCSTWRVVLKMFVRLFRIKARKSLKKLSTGAIYKEEKWKNRDGKSPWQLENAKTTRSLHNSCHRVSSLRDSLFCKNILVIILLWARKDVENFFEETVYKWVKENSRSRDIAFGTLILPKVA